MRKNKCGYSADIVVFGYVLKIKFAFGITMINLTPALVGIVSQYLQNIMKRKYNNKEEMILLSILTIIFICYYIFQLFEWSQF